MNKLQYGKNYNAGNYNQNYGIIDRISSSFGVVHGKKELHEMISYFPRYKITLPFLETRDLD